MDIFEFFYKKVSKSKRAREREKTSTVFLKDNLVYFHFILQYENNNIRKSQIQASLKHSGYFNEEIFLPDQIGVAETFAENLNIYKELIFLCAGIHNLKLSSKILTKSATAKRLETLKFYTQILKSVKEIFPFFEHKVVNLFSHNKLNSDYTSFSIWKKIVCEGEDSRNFNQEIDRLIAKCKENDSVPDFLFYTLPALSILDLQFINTQAQAKMQKTSDLVQTELKKDRKDIILNKSPQQNKKEFNPVMHSFEKMESLDDFDGKSGIEDSDDELEAHQKGLDEVQMSLSHDSTAEVKSVFQSDIQLGDQEHALLAETLVNTTTEHRMYPEWNYKKNTYIENFCHVFQSKDCTVELNNQLEEEIKRKYAKDLTFWQRKIDKIFNTPSWKKKQKIGEEIDIDQVLRLYLDKNKKDFETQKIYLKKNMSRADLSVLFLFDQSMSTDSWVGGERVLTVITESLILLSLLFRKLSFKSFIAGMNSHTHSKIEYVIYKDFQSNWDNVANRLARAQPRGYTRLGPAIRHSTRIMCEQESRRKIIILITDGKPTDLDAYEGQYGISDVKKALNEAEAYGIQTWALAIDNTHKSYFESMFKEFSIMPRPQLFAQELIKILIKLNKL